MPRKTLLLPDGKGTRNPDKFAKAWREFFAPIEGVLGIQIYGFDHDGSGSWVPTASSRLYKATKGPNARSLGYNLLQLPGWFVHRLRTVCMELNQNGIDVFWNNPNDPEKVADRMIEDYRQWEELEKKLKKLHRKKGVSNGV